MNKPNIILINGNDLPDMPTMSGQDLCGATREITTTRQTEQSP